MFFPILVLSMYIVALVVTGKLSLDIDKLANVSLKQDMETYVASKLPQNTADVEYWINEYTRKNQSFN
jgi:hypothetical protein